MLMLFLRRDNESKKKREEKINPNIPVMCCVVMLYSSVV